ncbi:tetratricopeptide repeat protein [Runella sp.]|uniref:tetratricopeptide repeat protein n=1 Tax=Runella sp. TaxID=1960881 RepID=UPI00301A3140
MKKLFILLLIMGEANDCLPQSIYLVEELADPRDLVQAHTYVGQRYWKKQNSNGAYLSFKDALYVAKKQGNNTDSCFYNLGVVCLFIGGADRNKEAQQHFEAVTNPSHFKHFWANKTIAYIANRQYGLAESAVQQTDTTQPLSWYLRGLIFLRKEALWLAKTAFQKAGRLQNLDPLPVAITFYKIRYLLSSKEKQQLSDFLAQAERYHRNRDSKNWQIAVWLRAMAYADDDKTQAAVSMLQKLSPQDSLVKYAYAYIYFKSGDDSLAKETLKSLVKRHRFWGEPYVMLGHIAVSKASKSDNKTEWQNSITYYTKAIQFSPLPSTLENRALSWLRLFDYRARDSDSCIVKALADIAEIRKLNPNYVLAYNTEMAETRAYHFIIYSLFYKRNSSNYFSKEEVKNYIFSAFKGYNDLIQKDASRSEAFQGLASLQLLLSIHQEAIENFKKANQIKPNVKHLLGIGMVYYEMVELETAGGYFQRVLQMEPTNKTALMGKGLVDWRTKKDTLGAIDKVQRAYFERENEPDDITRAMYIFNWASVKTQLFKDSGYPKDSVGFVNFVRDSVLYLYKEAKTVTPIADSGAYYANLGFEAEKLGFRALAVKWYELSNSIAGANNLAVLLAKEGDIQQARGILGRIAESSSTSKRNLALIDEGKINCGCLKSIEYMYLHVRFDLGLVNPPMDNSFVPIQETIPLAIKGFISFSKPRLQRYEWPLPLKGGYSGTRCPKII